MCILNLVYIQLCVHSCSKTLWNSACIMHPLEVRWYPVSGYTYHRTSREVHAKFSTRLEYSSNSSVGAAWVLAVRLNLDLHVCDTHYMYRTVRFSKAEERFTNPLWPDFFFELKKRASLVSGLVVPNKQTTKSALNLDLPKWLQGLIIQSTSKI